MKKILLILLLSTAGIAIWSCSKKDDTTTTPVATTPFELRMTDATVVYNAVNIDLQSVEVKTNSGVTVMLNVNPGIYNLLDFANGVDTLIASAILPTSTVSQVRLILGTNNSVVENGITYPLNTPSAQESGLKLQVHSVLQAGITYYMLIDFDANQSIVKTGNGQYQLKPVIRVVTQAANGSIRGIVAPVLALPAVVVAIDGGDTVSTSTDLTGNFLFQGMAAGTYKLIIEPQAPFINDTLINVNVSIGLLTELGTITL